MAHYARTRRSLAIIAVPPLLVASSISTGAAISSVRLSATVHVRLQNFALSRRTITIAPGATVTWTNKDGAPHTVTSDTGAWPASAQLSAGQTFSNTFTKAGTYAYHRAVHPYITAQVIVSSDGSRSGGSGTATGAGMADLGPVSKTFMAARTGYYDDKQLLYIMADTSSKAEATRDHINYVPTLAKALAHTVPMYLIFNGKYAKRGPVFGSWPGKADYTSLWQEVLVTWTDPGQAVALGQEDQITALAKLVLTLLLLPVMLTACGGAGKSGY